MRRKRGDAVFFFLLWWKQLSSSAVFFLLLFFFPRKGVTQYIVHCAFKRQHVCLSPVLRAQWEWEGRRCWRRSRPRLAPATADGGDITERRGVRWQSVCPVWCKITCPFMEPARWFYCGPVAGEAARLLLLPPNPRSPSSPCQKKGCNDSSA